MQITVRVINGKTEQATIIFWNEQKYGTEYNEWKNTQYILDSIGSNIIMNKKRYAKYINTEYKGADICNKKKRYS
jgi:hypothetical protein